MLPCSNVFFIEAVFVGGAHGGHHWRLGRREEQNTLVFYKEDIELGGKGGSTRRGRRLPRQQHIALSTRQPRHYFLRSYIKRDCLHQGKGGKFDWTRRLVISLLIHSQTPEKCQIHCVLNKISNTGALPRLCANVSDACEYLNIKKQNLDLILYPPYASGAQEARRDATLAGNPCRGRLQHDICLHYASLPPGL